MAVGCVGLIVTPAQLEERKAFYKTVLATLGYKELHSTDAIVRLADSSGIPDFLIIVKKDSDREPTKDVHIGFRAPDRDTVHKFHAAALAAGASDNGEPGPRDYMPSYYAGYVRDAAGNNLECYHI